MNDGIFYEMVHQGKIKVFGITKTNTKRNETKQNKDCHELNFALTFLKRQSKAGWRSAPGQVPFNLKMDSHWKLMSLCMALVRPCLQFLLCRSLTHSHTLSAYLLHSFSPYVHCAFFQVSSWKSLFWNKGCDHKCLTRTITSTCIAICYLSHLRCAVLLSMDSVLLSATA